MEASDQDVMGSHSSSSTGTGPTVLKRKRSKRPLPPRAPPASSSSTSSVDYLSSATEEEEDMAHCLILLAQGRALADSSTPPPPPAAEKFTSRRFTETTTTAGGKAGFYVYECKTCNKCFPSFQALGGHRASHRKPKLAPPVLKEQDNKSLIMNDNIVLEGGLDISINNAFSKPANVHTTNSPTNNSNNKMRVHECSICGAEFSSGQALGGHMRRHRLIGAGPSSPTQEVVVLKTERNVLSLDLNLPAPADDNPQPPPVAATAFSFADKRPMVFSATSAAALVDCHY